MLIIGIILVIIFLLFLLYFLFNSFFNRIFTSKSFSIKHNGNSDEFTNAEFSKQINCLKQTFLEKKPKDLWIVNSKGNKLHAYFLENPNSLNKIIITSHGWKSTGLTDYALIGSYYYQKGYSILVVDHQAHGMSEGKYIGFGVLDSYNLRQWIYYINHLFDSKCQIFLHGLSMGANAVLLLANQNLPNTVKGIIADCGFTSGWDEFLYLSKKFIKKERLLPIYLLKWNCQLRARYNFKDNTSLETVANAKLPILFIHGGNDNFVPQSMTQQLFNLCPTSKKLKIFERAAHAKSWYEYPEEYEKLVFNFIEEIINA